MKSEVLLELVPFKYDGYLGKSASQDVWTTICTKCFTSQNAIILDRTINHHSSRALRICGYIWQAFSHNKYTKALTWRKTVGTVLQLITLNFGKHAPALIWPSEDNLIYMGLGLKLWSTRLAQHCWAFSEGLGVILRNLRNLSFSFCWFPSCTPLLGLKLSMDSRQNSTRVSGSFWREDGSCFQEKCSEVTFSAMWYGCEAWNYGKDSDPKGKPEWKQKKLRHRRHTEQLNPMTLDLWTPSTALTAGTSLTWGLDFQHEDF